MQTEHCHKKKLKIAYKRIYDWRKMGGERTREIGELMLSNFAYREGRYIYSNLVVYYPPSPNQKSCFSLKFFPVMVYMKSQWILF